MITEHITEADPIDIVAEKVKLRPSTNFFPECTKKVLTIASLANTMTCYSDVWKMDYPMTFSQARTRIIERRTRFGGGSTQFRDIRLG